MNAFGFGNIVTVIENPFFTQSYISNLVKRVETDIECVTIIGFNELTEEQYNIYINKQ